MKTVIGVFIAKTLAAEYQPLAYFFLYALACLIVISIVYWVIVIIKIFIRGFQKIYVQLKNDTPYVPDKIGPDPLFREGDKIWINLDAFLSYQLEQMSDANYRLLPMKQWGRAKWGYVQFKSNPPFDVFAHARSSLRTNSTNMKYEWAIKPKYKAAGLFVNSFARVLIGNKWGFINQNGVMVIKPSFHYVENFSRDGLARIKVGALWSYIDSGGSILFDPRYDEVRPFNYYDEDCSTDRRSAMARANVRRGSLWGYIDRRGIEVIPPCFSEESELFFDQPSPVAIEGKAGYINFEGAIIINATFDSARPFNGWELAPVMIDEKWGFINKQGAQIVAPQFSDVSDFQDGLACVELDGYKGFIDEFGLIIITPRFDDCSNFVDGVCRVKQNGKYGFVDRSGGIIVKPVYDYIDESFIEGLARVKIGGKYGFINKSGVVVIAPLFKHAEPFKNGVSVAISDRGEVSIDKDGNVV